MWFPTSPARACLPGPDEEGAFCNLLFGGPGPPLIGQQAPIWPAPAAVPNRLISVITYATCSVKVLLLRETSPDATNTAVHPLPVCPSCLLAAPSTLPLPDGCQRSSISRECLHDIWETKRAQHRGLDVQDPLVAIPTGKVDYDINTYSTSAVLRDFQDDGLVYVELRTTPRAIPETGVTKENYVKTVLDILNAHNDDSRNSMRAFLILSIDRRNTIAEADQVVDLAVKYKSAGVVGVDLCGDPAKGDIRIFQDSFARAKASGLKITLHFAESEPSSSDLELRTLLSWNPDRLGHVIHVKEEFRKVIEQRAIGVELCLSCNVHAKMITGTYSDHHFGIWRHSSVPVALSTDDVGVFGSPLSQEYFLAAQHFHLDRKDIRALCERAVDSIFTGPTEQARLRHIYATWDGWHSAFLLYKFSENSNRVRSTNTITKTPIIASHTQWPGNMIMCCARTMASLFVIIIHDKIHNRLGLLKILVIIELESIRYHELLRIAIPAFDPIKLALCKVVVCLMAFKLQLVVILLLGLFILLHNGT
ncbi:adenosine deaminase [Pyrenophora seminiperda CCB06]|uniref:Adenosine deaminase n=1 Tax=Pyrenophora seminiperda CCB06 TaxID=1302712 RepID=A0A3M7MA30_9PLEO|nr:adenosine deaminase [Pyrenophora seminiperda CCB06]